MALDSLSLEYRYNVVVETCIVLSIAYGILRRHLEFAVIAGQPRVLIVSSDTVLGLSEHTPDTPMRHLGHLDNCLCLPLGIVNEVLSNGFQGFGNTSENILYFWASPSQAVQAP